MKPSSKKTILLVIDNHSSCFISYFFYFSCMTADKIINFKRNFGMYISDLQEKKQLLQKAFTFNHRKRNGFVVDDADDFDGPFVWQVPPEIALSLFP